MSEEDISCWQCEENNEIPQKQSKFSEESCYKHYTCERCKKPIDEMPKYYCYKCLYDEIDNEEEIEFFYDSKKDYTFVMYKGEYCYQDTCPYHGAAIVCVKCVDWTLFR